MLYTGELMMIYEADPPDKLTTRSFRIKIPNEIWFYDTFFFYKLNENEEEFQQITNTESSIESYFFL